MANDLTDYIAATGINEIDAMNLLQGDGVISDNCIWVSDVANADCEKAVEYLKKNLK